LSLSNQAFLPLARYLPFILFSRSSAIDQGDLFYIPRGLIHCAKVQDTFVFNQHLPTHAMGVCRLPKMNLPCISQCPQSKTSIGRHFFDG